MDVQGEVVGSLDYGATLQLRVDVPEFEKAKGAKTNDAQVMVPWPLEPQTIINFYYGNPWLGAIGNLLADSVASAEWELKPREVDLEGKAITRMDREQDKDYMRARAWLSRENVGLEGVSQLDLAGLLKAMSSAYDQTANIFVEVIRNRAANEPVQLNHILPQYVRYWAKDGQLELYQMDPIRGEFSFVPFGQRGSGKQDAREYLHQRHPNTVSSYYGVPQWYWSKDSVETDNEHRSYLKGFFKRHTTPRYMIEVSQDPAWTGGQPDKDQREAVYKHVKNFLNANAGDMAGRNLIIQYPGGIMVKATALDTKIEDPTFPNTSKNMRDEILAVRHISLTNLGGLEGANRSISEEQSDNFINNTLEPFAAPAVAIINRILHAPAPSGLGIGTYDFTLKFERVDDLLKRMKAIVTAVGGPVLTQVEGRELAGYEEKGSSEVFQPVNMVPGMGSSFGGPDGGGDE